MKLPSTNTVKSHSRSDAIRNNTQILDAARSLFHEQGTSVSLEEVAKAAKVGIGTIYRHFPNKQALLEAIVIEATEALVEEGRMLSKNDPNEALFELLRIVVESGVHKRALVEAFLASGGQPGSHLHALKAELDDLLDSTLQEAQKTGAVRSDVTVRDVKALLTACMLAESHSGQKINRSMMVRVISDGLRATH